VDAFIHAVDLAGVAAEQVIAQVEAVLHHLELNQVRGLGQFLGGGGCILSVVLAAHSHPVDDEQKDHP
jgi:hypothetical protein